MNTLSLTALIWLEDDIYVSKCPEIEVSSAGESPDEALKNLKEAVELWLENAKKLQILEDYLGTITSKTRFTSTIEIEV